MICIGEVRCSGFTLIEKSTFFYKNKLTGHFLSSCILLFFFTGILIAEGLVFQWAYHYFHIDWYAYWGAVLFNTFPLMLFSGLILLINDNIRNRFLALGLSVLAVFLFTGPLSKNLFHFLYSEYFRTTPESTAISTDTELMLFLLQKD